MDVIEKIFENNKCVKAKAFIDAGLSYKDISAYEEDGSIKRVKSGYYVLGEAEVSDEELVISLFPDGIMSMESAAFYHGYMERRPFHWSIAINKNTSKSRFKIDYPIIHPFYAEESALEFGVTKKTLGELEFNIYDRDRLICEILKYQEKVEKDDFREIMTSYINDPEKNLQNLLSYAKKRRILKRVQSVIAPWI